MFFCRLKRWFTWPVKHHLSVFAVVDFKCPHNNVNKSFTLKNLMWLETDQIVVPGPDTFLCPDDQDAEKQNAERQNIFFIETSGEPCLTARQACLLFKYGLFIYFLFSISIVVFCWISMSFQPDCSRHCLYRRKKINFWEKFKQTTYRFAGSTEKLRFVLKITWELT